MRKKPICCLALALTLGLSGCADWTNGSYVSVTAHQEHRPMVLAEDMRVASYDQLESALKQMIDNRLESGTLVLEYYDDAAAEKDLESAVEAIQDKYPMAVYSEAVITYSKAPEQTVIPVTIAYSLTKQQMDQVVSVRSSKVHEQLQQALREVSSEITILVSQSEPLDYGQIVEDYATEHPDHVIEVPRVSVKSYPENGKEQIVEIQFEYQTNRDTLREYRRAVASAYDLIRSRLDRTPSADDKFEVLYRELAGYSWTENPSLTPAYTLMADRYGDNKAFVLNFAALGRLAGLDITSISGTRNGEPWSWNLCKLGDSCFYVDLKSSAEKDRQVMERLYDEDMEGYLWNNDSGIQAIRPEVVEEDTAPTEAEP